ncbi:hypothetical protein FRC0393_00209 [Corynebacterium diphtheriae]|nr:hypothetical protein FRC0061_00201 [Corynebacterium diphtheriae]CAB0844241.1 hypothetical protein FRC0383_00209 [Corynebacterium diphtheriae]CAB0876139.1 hypothetical protein FRC0393_00209 [Corynebacterium diphtheriae]CAB0886844.1 hypothetical protein FRC0419_00137 [Corynebacterium diphtheriae]CAB0935650.1 hypothetical protein FRC0466_00137 [Corynebacterium diphtheriae]
MVKTFKGLIPIVHRSQALEPLLKPGVVVPEDIIIYGPIKLINTGEVLAVVHFGLQMTEEVLSSPRCRSSYPYATSTTHHQ